MGSIAFVHLVVIFASVIVLSHAMPARQEDVERLLSRLQQQDAPVRYDDIGHNVRNLDSLGGGNLLRDTRGMDSLAGITFGGVKRFDSLSGITFGGQKRSLNDVVPYEHQHYYPQCLQPVKRVNFDEIDHSGFVGFQKKNFDEIDHSNFGSFVKRDPSGRLIRLRY